MNRGFQLGLLGGLIVACLGSWKDTLFEPFEWKKFIRSPLIGAISGGIVGDQYPDSPGLLIFGTAITLERLTVETWKAIIRKPPGKFVNPERDTGWLAKRLSGQSHPQKVLGVQHMAPPKNRQYVNKAVSAY